MGAFSGPDAFKWLHLTPEATAVLQADPFLFAELLIVLFGLSTMFVIAWYIHFVTSKPYKKPAAKAKPGEKSGAKGLVPRIAPWVSRTV